MDTHIEDKLETILDTIDKKKLVIISSKLPSYRFVDLYQAIESFVRQREKSEIIHSEHNEDLKSIIHSRPYNLNDRILNSSTRTTWQKSQTEDIYLPLESFWVCSSKTENKNIIIRLKYEQYQDKASIEVACTDKAIGEQHLNKIIANSAQKSIYRGQIIHLVHQSEKRDEYGDIEKQERLQVTFSKITGILDKDIILSQEHVDLLRRNILDLYDRKEILEANNIPTKRGILLYGPPGTGKTFACRYICNQLNEVTKFFISGSTLSNISAVFSLARLYQPAIIFIEDADLMFSSRDMNIYGTVLGELMDQMDGMQTQENISIVMTTNAIERIEDALKNRPGRISQCIYMGEPNADLRKKYLTHLLEEHNVTKANIDKQVKNSIGTTQAFLKEWVLRTIQIACERISNKNEKPMITDKDFDEAMAEMKKYLENNGSQIIGFTNGLN